MTKNMAYTNGYSLVYRDSATVLYVPLRTSLIFGVLKISRKFFILDNFRIVVCIGCLFANVEMFVIESQHHSCTHVIVISIRYLEICTIK